MDSLAPVPPHDTDRVFGHVLLIAHAMQDFVPTLWYADATK